MNSSKWIKLVLSFVLLALVFLPNGQADVWNKKTIVTFSEPVELPTGVVLQPGQYVMKLLDSPSNRHIVQIFNGEEKHVYATILAIPNYRLKPTGKTVISFHEMPSGQPKAMRAWFYPGDNFGQEFAYPAKRATEIAAVTGQEVPKLSSDDEATLGRSAAAPEQSTAKEEATNGESKPARETEVAQANPPESRPAETPAPSESLPQTASNLPFLMLTGLLSLGGALGIRVIASRLA